MTGSAKTEGSQIHGLPFDSLLACPESIMLRKCSQIVHKGFLLLSTAISHGHAPKQYIFSRKGGKWEKKKAMENSE